MNCPNCGASMQQGPLGDWACENCGGTGVAPAARELMVSRCYRCQADVVDGPRGGYCCGQCGDVVPPLPDVVAEPLDAEAVA
jgi:hypothetical protein